MADPPSSAADVTAEPDRSNGVSAWRAPGSRWLGCRSCSGGSLLELLPVLVFVGVATMLLGTEIGDLGTTRLVILAVVNAYALSRGLICVVRALAGPFGLFRVRAETAAYIEIWARRIVTVGVSGFAFANVALLLGSASRRLRCAAASGDAGRASLYRRHHPAVPPAGRRRHSRAGRPRGRSARVRNRIAGLWHILAIALDLALWAVWAMNIRNGYSLLLQYFVGTIAVALITRLAIIVVLSLIDRGFSISPDILQRFPGLEIPRQSLSAAAAQDRLRHHRFHRLRCVA